MRDLKQIESSDEILYYRNAYVDDIEFALTKVAEYIRENELIIVGGMAIDYAMRLKGDKLYEDTAIPDYDIVTPDNLAHADAIAKIICHSGVDDVAVLPAIHKTTVRIMMRGQSVFDATYIPESIYSNIPTLVYSGMRFVHPDYQRIDQHISLALMWDITGPTFNIINRLEKDMCRKSIMDEMYPIKCIEHSIPSDTITWEIRKHKVTYDKKDLSWCGDDKTHDINHALHGIVGMAVLKEKLIRENVLKDADFMVPTRVEPGKIKVPNINAKSFGPIDIISIADHFRLLAGELSHPKVNAIVLERSVTPEYTVHDITGHNLPVHIVDLDGSEIYVAHYHYIMAYFLFLYFHTKDPIYTALYNDMKLIESAFSDTIIDDIMFNPYGYWYDENYEYFEKNFISLSTTMKSYGDLPEKRYLDTPACDIKRNFTYSDSEYYVLDIYSKKDNLGLNPPTLKSSNCV